MTTSVSVAYGSMPDYTSVLKLEGPRPKRLGPLRLGPSVSITHVLHVSCAYTYTRITPRKTPRCITFSGELQNLPSPAMIVFVAKQATLEIFP